MMVSSEIRTEARKSLQGKWGKSALIILIYALIMSLISFVAGKLSWVGSLIETIIGVPIAYGLISTFIKLKRGEDVSYVAFLTDGFSSFSKAWGVALNIVLKLLPWVIAEVLVILVIGITSFQALSLSSSPSSSLSIAVIMSIASVVISIVIGIKSLYYALSNFVLFDNPNLTGKEIVEKSKELMTNNRWNLVKLTLTFIGWAILCVFTLGIGYLWLLPYIQVATVVFYEDKLNSLNN